MCVKFTRKRGFLCLNQETKGNDMKRTRLTVAVILGCFIVPTLLLHAQPGSLDVTFNPSAGPNGIVRAVAAQPDGKVLILGDFTQVNGVATRIGMARLNTDGSLDADFDTGSGLWGNGAQKIRCMSLLQNGQILVAGNFDTISGLSYNCIARLRADGSVDTTFKSDAGLGNIITTLFCIAVHTNGQIVVGGICPSVGRNVVRLNFDGSLDASFTNSGDGYVYATAIQSDGKVIVGGDSFTINGASVNRIARLNNDGSSDTNFHCTVATTGSPGISSIRLLNDGKILIGGNFLSINGYTRYNIARLNSDGTTDVTFNPGESTKNALYVSSVALQGDGKILVGGGDLQVFDNPLAARIMRLNTNGVLDLSFNASPSNTVYAVALQSDGKTLIGGSFTKVGGTNINYIARLNSDTSSTTLNLLSAQTYFGTYLQGTVSNTYRVEHTAKINTSNLWTPLFTLTLQTNPQFILDPTPATGTRFYRAVQLSP